MKYRHVSRERFNFHGLRAVRPYRNQQQGNAVAVLPDGLLIILAAAILVAIGLIVHRKFE